MIIISTRFNEGNFNKWTSTDITSPTPFRLGGVNFGTCLTCNAGAFANPNIGSLGLKVFDDAVVGQGGTFRFNFSFYRAVFDPNAYVNVCQIFDSQNPGAHFEAWFWIKADGTATIAFRRTNSSGWDEVSTVPGVIPTDGSNHAYQLNFNWGDINNGRVILYMDDVKILDQVYHPADSTGIFWNRAGYNNIRILTSRYPTDTSQSASLMTRFAEFVFDNEGIILGSYTKYPIPNIGMDFCQSTFPPDPVTTRFNEGNWNFWWPDNTDVSIPAPANNGGLDNGPSNVCVSGAKNVFYGRIGRQLFDPQYIIFGYNLEAQYSLFTTEALLNTPTDVIEVADNLAPFDRRFRAKLSITPSGAVILGFLYTNGLAWNTVSTAPGIFPLDGSNHAIQWAGSWGDINNHIFTVNLDGVQILNGIYHPTTDTGITWIRGGYNTVRIYNVRNPVSLALDARTMSRFAEFRINYPVAPYAKWTTLPNLTAGFCNTLTPPPPPSFGNLTIAKVIDQVYDKETTFDINAGSLGTFQLTMDTEKLFNGIPTGAYPISETAIPGYVAQIFTSNGSPASGVTVDAGENVSVVIVNTRAKRPFSGLYYIQKDKRHDTLIDSFVDRTYKELAIPNPFADTALIGDE